MNGPIKQRGTYRNCLSIGIASYDVTFLPQTYPSVSIHSFFIKGFSKSIENILLNLKLYRSVVTGKCFKILTKCIALIRILQFFVLNSLGKKSKHLQTKSSTVAVKQSPISTFIFIPSTSKKSVNLLKLFRMITKYNSVKSTPVIADAILKKM